MSRTCLLLTLLFALLLPPALSSGVLADEPAADGSGVGARTDILPLDRVRPGMKGQLVTIVEGTTPQRFDVEVVDVFRNYLAKQDVILIRCLGDEIHRLGVAQGMSGSPVFVDGKIMGALSYTWGWAREPIAGVTPIESMLAEAERPLEGNPSGALEPTPIRRRPPPIPLESDATTMRPIATPLSMGGYSAESRREILEALRPMGFGGEAVGGGLVSGAPQRWADLDAPLEPGCALVVDLVRGDLSLSAVGTCTWIEGDKILAFGHPFASMGETLLPMSVGYVYTIVPSRQISFKLGAALREVGALVQDRDAGIVGIRGLHAPMLPVTVTVRNAVTKREEKFRVEITKNRQFLQRMLFISLRDLLTKAEGTMGENTKKYRMTVKLKALDEPWSYEDAVAGFDTGFSRTFMSLVDRVLIHPTERTEFEWVDLDVEIENRDRRAFIESITTSKEDVRPGETVEILVRLRKKDGGQIVYERLPVVIPATAPAGGFAVAVAGGDMVSAEAAAPVDIADLPALYNAFYKSTELIAQVPTGRVDLDMGGRLIKNLPLSTLPRLIRSADAVGVNLRPVTEKVRKKVPYIIVGQGAVQLNVLR